MTATPLTDQQLDDIQARATSEHLTPGPWTLDKEGCDCGGDYPCGHGLFVTAVITTTPTWSAAERCKQSGEQPRDYDFHRSDIGDFTGDDWELMAHARQDVPALVAEVRRLRAANAELEAGNAWRDSDRERWADVHALVERAIDKGWSVIDTLDLEAELGPEPAAADHPA